MPSTANTWRTSSPMRATGCWRRRLARKLSRSLGLSTQPWSIADIVSTMRGHEFVRELRTEEATSNIPVIFMRRGRAAQDEARRLAEACGVSQILVKPWEPEQVMGVVAEELDVAREQLRVLNAQAAPKGGGAEDGQWRTRTPARGAFQLRAGNRRIPDPARDASVECAHRHWFRGSRLPHSPHEHEACGRNWPPDRGTARPHCRRGRAGDVGVSSSRCTRRVLETGEALVNRETFGDSSIGVPTRLTTG